MVHEEASAEDRRITRSKAALRKSFIELVQERGLDNFSVNDLCAHAGLNRGTFYNHFKDKDDLLSKYEQEILNTLDCFQPEIKKLTLSEVWAHEVNKQPLSAFVHIFEYLASERDFLCAIISRRGDASFAGRLRDAVCNDFILGMLHERYRKNPSSFVNYYVAYYASAYMGVIERWLVTGMKETPEEMAVIALHLLFIKPGQSIEL